MPRRRPDDKDGYVPQWSRTVSPEPWQARWYIRADPNPREDMALVMAIVQAAYLERSQLVVVENPIDLRNAASYLTQMMSHFKVERQFEERDRRDSDHEMAWKMANGATLAVCHPRSWRLSRLPETVTVLGSIPATVYASLKKRLVGFGACLLTVELAPGELPEGCE